MTELKEIYIHQKRDNKTLMILDCFRHHRKMEYQKIINLLDTTSDTVPKFVTKNWIEVSDQSGTAEDRYKPSKQIQFKTSMLRSDLCDYSNAYIVVKGTIIVTEPNNNAYDKKLAFKIMYHLIVALQKLIIYSLTMQKIWTL